MVSVRRSRRHQGTAWLVNKRRKSRRLLVEQFEARRLLALTVLDETFKVVDFSVTGSYSGRDYYRWVEVPTSFSVDAYSGTTTDTGHLAFTSPTNGTGVLSGSGSGSGVHDPDSYDFSFAGHSEIEYDNGVLNRVNSVQDHFQTSDSTTGGNSPYRKDMSGTLTTSSYPFQAESDWYFQFDFCPVEEGGICRPEQSPDIIVTSTGSWQGQVQLDDNAPFDIVAGGGTWNEAGTAITVNFEMSGRPHTTSNPGTQITTIRAYWASDMDASSVINAPLASIPVYWNHASVEAELTNIPRAPENARYLLFIADYTNTATETSDDNNVIAVELPDVRLTSLAVVEGGGAEFEYRVDYAAVAQGVGVRYYWATGPTWEERSVEAGSGYSGPGTLGQHGPISISADSLGVPPSDTTHLLVVVDPAESTSRGILDEFDESNNLQSLAIDLAPLLEVEVNPEGTLYKNQRYTVNVLLTSNTFVNLEVPITWTEIYPANHQEIGLAPQAPAGGSQVAPLKPFKTEIITLGTWSHHWYWIPQESPANAVSRLIAELTTSLALSAIFKNKLTSAFAGSFLDTAEALMFFDSAVHNAHAEISVPVQVSIDDNVATVVPVNLKVADKYGYYYTGYIAAELVASVGLRSALPLVWTNPPLGLAALAGKVGLWLAAGHLYEQAQDPPDPNFTELAIPEPVPGAPQEVSHGGLLSWQARQVLGALSLQRAEGISRDRALGAAIVGDVEWEVRQLLAASDYASQNALLSTRRVAQEMLIAPFTSQLYTSTTPEDVKTFLRNDGFPAEVTNMLLAAGWTAENVDTLKDAFLSSEMEDHEASSDLAVRLTAVMAAASAARELLEAVELSVAHLGGEVRELTTEEAADLAALKAAVEQDYARGQPLPDVLSRLESFIRMVRSLLLATNNAAVLSADLELGYGILIDYQRYDWSLAGLATRLAVAETDGLLPPELASSLLGRISAAEGFVAAGDFSAAVKEITWVQRTLITANLPDPLVGGLLPTVELMVTYADAFPWQDNFDPADVTGDGRVNAGDLRTQITELLSPRYLGSDRRLPDRSLHPLAPNFDSSGDGFLKTGDLILVLQRLLFGAGEAEAASVLGSAAAGGSPADVAGFIHATLGVEPSSGALSREPAAKVRRIAAAREVAGGFPVPAKSGDSDPPSVSRHRARKPLEPDQLDAVFADLGAEIELEIGGDLETAA